MIRFWLEPLPLSIRTFESRRNLSFSLITFGWPLTIYFSNLFIKDFVRLNGTNNSPYLKEFFKSSKTTVFGIVKPCTLWMVHAYANFNGNCVLLIICKLFLLVKEYVIYSSNWNNLVCIGIKVTAHQLLTYYIVGQQLMCSDFNSNTHQVVPITRVNDIFFDKQEQLAYD